MVVPSSLRAALLASSLCACGLTADFSGLQGGSRADAGEDSGEAAAPAPAFCATLARATSFCADFDESTDVGAGWSGLDVSLGAQVLLDGVARSSPSSFLSTFGLDAPAPVNARLRETLPTNTTHVVLGFDMLVDASVGSMELAVIHQRTADGTRYGLFYKEDDGGKLLLYSKTLTRSGDVAQQNDVIAPPSPGWMHVEIDARFSEDAGSYLVKHDGQVVVSEAHIPTETPSHTDMLVELGYSTPTTASGKAHFDNVTIDWTSD